MEARVGYAESITRARPAMWCCLSCGMPFTYPEESYDVDNARVQALITVSRGMRLALADPSLPCTQWNAARVPLLSDDIAKAVDPLNVEGEGGGVFARLRRLWSAAMEAAGALMVGADTLVSEEIVGLLEALGAEGGVRGGGGRFLVGEERERSVLLCQGCSAVSASVFSAASNSSMAGDRGFNAVAWFQANRNTLGGSADALLLCAISAAHVSALATARHSIPREGEPQRSEHEAWRIECLARLHLGNLVYTASKFQTGGAVPFDAWYACIFHPVLEYERHRDGDLGTCLSDRAIAEVISRAAAVCREHPYAWVHHRFAVRGAEPTRPAYSDYYRFSGTEELMRIAANPSIPWAPVCAIYGLPGDLLLRRLRASTKCFGWLKEDRRAAQGRFASKGSIMRVLLVYMDEEAGFARASAAREAA